MISPADVKVHESVPTEPEYDVENAYTLPSVDVKMTKPRLDTTGTDWIAAVDEIGYIHLNTARGPTGPVYADNPVCWLVRPNWPQTWAIGVGETEDVGVSVMDRDGEGVTDVDAVIVAVTVRVLVPDAVEDAVAEAVTVGVVLLEGDVDAEELNVTVADGEPDALGVGDNVTVAVAVTVGVALTLRVTVGDIVTEIVTVAVVVNVGVMVTEALGVTLGVGDALGLATLYTALPTATITALSVVIKGPYGVRTASEGTPELPMEVAHCDTPVGVMDRSTPSSDRKTM